MAHRLNADLRRSICLSFRDVNRRDRPDYDPGLQKHHILPVQLRSRPPFDRMLSAIPDESGFFDDFRRNGLLLPCRETVVRRIALPLHRGPHPHYSDMVAERLGQIEGSWGRTRLRDPRAADMEAAMRLDLLRRALKRMILDVRRRRIRLNRRDPFAMADEFSDLDAMAEQLWTATA
jgi:hypothetical protein